MGETVVPAYYSKAPLFCTNNTCPMKKYCLLKRRNFDKVFKDARYETYLLHHFGHWQTLSGYNCAGLTQYKYLVLGTLQFLARWGYDNLSVEDLVKIKFWRKQNG